jgi:hypothetical protein
MTKDQAIEKCARAMLKRRGLREENWLDQPTQNTLAADIVAALEALELWPQNEAPRGRGCRLASRAERGRPSAPWLAHCVCAERLNSR